ncbi:MAG: histidine kinase [Geobacteraceae bacterium GWC2_55_20]|nr:MAG: histidine kinase [Geobacteraceae bacterium GWC2_55_20]OGU26214.1 MAG: histidine kinase [Geobacteraceae bacterium GWF2_54_21]
MRIKSILRFVALLGAALALNCVHTASLRAVEIDVTPPAAIVIGGDRDYPPYEFLDKNGKPAGYNVELTRAIADVMGMQVEFRFGGWSEMRTALINGSVDVLQGISYSDDRTRTLSFSPPHTIINHAIFARRDTLPVSSVEELRGKEIVVFRDGIMHDYLASLGFGQNLIMTDTPADALRLLASGKHDYAVLAMLPGMYIIRENKLSNLVPVAKSISTQRYCYGVKKGNEELLARFNEGLAILKKTGRYQEIYDRWLGVLGPPKVAWEKVLWYGGMVLIPLLAILVGTVIWSRTLQKRVARRTGELALEVAERKRALEELRRHQDKLIQADKMASLGILVAGVAHEINNPNGLILLNMPILREVYRDAEEILEERYRAQGDFTLGGLPYSRMRNEVPCLLEEMQEGANRIKRIVEELKDFARQDVSAATEVLDFNAVVQTAVRLVDSSIRAATNRFETDYAPNLPAISGNAQRIEQVVVNLILNACQSLPDMERGIFLTTGYDQSADCVVLELIDQGGGIAPEHVAHLTDPFFTTKRETGGTGLGLSVSASIVKEHDGLLEFDSNPGAGTTVTLKLPCSKRR